MLSGRARSHLLHAKEELDSEHCASCNTEGNQDQIHLRLYRVYIGILGYILRVVYRDYRVYIEVIYRDYRVYIGAIYIYMHNVRFVGSRLSGLRV